jgi:hypothetical protein
MSYQLSQTLQYGVTPPQAFATIHAQLTTGFPLESALAANLSPQRPLAGVLKIARACNTILKVPPGEAAHFFSARAHNAEKTGIRARSCANENVL